MLRALKHAFSSPRLLGFKATSLSGACTVNVGTDDVYSAASASTGKSYLTLVDVFNRTPVVVATPVFATGNESGAALIDADPTIALLSLKNHDGTNPIDGALHALALGYDCHDASYLPSGRQSAPFTVKSSWHAPRLEVFKVTPHATTPTIDIGAAKATLTRNGAGDYTVTFKRPFSTNEVVAVALPIKTTISHVHVVTATALAVNIKIGASGSLSDSYPFYLVVQGSDNPIACGGQRKTLRLSDRLPRIIAGQVSWSTGTPSITQGTGDFTITDTGTGQLTVTPVVSFAREAIVVASQNKAGNVTTDAANTGGAFQLDFFNAAGSATDPDDAHFFAIGFDDDQEYALF